MPWAPPENFSGTIAKQKKTFWVFVRRLWKTDIFENFHKINSLDASHKQNQQFSYADGKNNKFPTF